MSARKCNVSRFYQLVWGDCAYIRFEVSAVRGRRDLFYALKFIRRSLSAGVYPPFIRLLPASGGLADWWGGADSSQPFQKNLNKSCCELFITPAITLLNRICYITQKKIIDNPDLL